MPQCCQQAHLESHQQRLSRRMFGPFGCRQHWLTDCLAQRKLQIPEHVSNRTLPRWLLHARLSARNRLTSICPDAILDTPLPIKSKPLLTCNRCNTLDLMENCAKLASSKLIRGKSNTVKTPGLDTSWRPLANKTRLYAGV